MARVIDGLVVEGEEQQRFLLPRVRVAIESLRAEAKKNGIGTKVRDYGGSRTKKIVDQLITWRDEAVKDGEPYYRVSPYESGKHAVGGAEDLEVTSRPAGMTEAAAYATLGRLCTKYGLIWGGTFSAPADIYHFESKRTRAEMLPEWNTFRASPDFPKPGILSNLSALGDSVALSSAEHSTALYVALGVALVIAVIIFSRRRK